MNRAVLMGRLTRDPEIRTSGETTIARFTLAVDRRNRDEADFISCVAFNKLAEFAQKYLKQGTKICAEGRIQTGSYTDQDGKKRYTTDVILDGIEFAESKKTQAQDEFVPDEEGIPSR